MALHHIEDATHERASLQFSEVELAALTTSIAAINAWNRIAGSLRFAPPGVTAKAERTA
jgi:alkylhydroperoxidase family enzyme